jgi:hypothetical protein
MEAADSQRKGNNLTEQNKKKQKEIAGIAEE